jgi:phospholipid/cholesterol/gamma-HCH transport system substrate-binding protein
MSGSDFRVGVMTFSALIVLVVAIVFAGGDKGLLFRKTATVKAQLHDVGGLKKGASVTMGGMAVGRVTEITFMEAWPARQIEVLMAVRSDVLDRVRRDSVPSVRTQGMLGDRYVDISMGTEDSPTLGEGEALVGKEASDFDEVLRSSDVVLKETEKVLVAINEQQGAVGKFFYDEKLYERLMQIARRFEDILTDFKERPRRYLKFSLF